MSYNKVIAFALVTKAPELGEEIINDKPVKRVLLAASVTRSWMTNEGEEKSKTNLILAKGYGDRMAETLADWQVGDWVELRGKATVTATLRNGEAVGRLDLALEQAVWLGHPLQGSAVHQSLYAIVVGNLGREPEMRFTPAGVPVTGASLATNVWSHGQETAVWFKLTFWRKNAETAAEHLHKGKLIVADGNIELEPYMSKKGEPACSIALDVNEFRMLGGSQGNGGSVANREPIATGAGGGAVEANDPW